MKALQPGDLLHRLIVAPRGSPDPGPTTAGAPAGDGNLVPMKYAQSVLDLIGNTPLVKLNHVTDGIAATVLVKLEYLNPGGSIKDRIAVKMIEEAERTASSSPAAPSWSRPPATPASDWRSWPSRRATTASSWCRTRWARTSAPCCRRTAPKWWSPPPPWPPDSPQSYYGVSDRLVTEIPGAYKPDQFSNPAGPGSHYETTGPEIWRDTDGKVTHCVIGAGTGGTITGTGRYLKEVSADRPEAEGGLVKIIGADPAGSVYSGGTGPALLRRGRRRGHVAGQLRQGRAGRRHCRQRRRLLRDDPPAGPRGRPAGGRLLRHGRGGRAAGRQGPAGRTPSSS